MAKDIIIEATIGASGALKLDITGARGQECLDSLLAGLEDLLGEPDETVKKPEYRQRPRQRRQKRVRNGR